MSKVAINPGHAEDAGAFGNGINEEDMADIIADRLGHYLRERGHETLIIQQEGRVTLGRIGEIAIDAHCDLFISLHFNAVADPSANGVEAFAVKNDWVSRRIADQLLEAIATIKIGGRAMKNRGAKWDTATHVGSLAVLRDAHKTMPAVLLELGFISNVSDAQEIKTPRWREDVANVLAQTIGRVVG
jgi:N-acetylmuramoyl-L-alanine amidase